MVSSQLGHGGSFRLAWKVAESTPPLAATLGPLASPSLVIACMMDVVNCISLAAKFDSCNSLSVHTLLVNSLQCVKLYIKRKYYY